MIIKKTGEYRTRDGRRALVHDINERPVSFPVRGSLYKIYRGKETPRGNRIWAIDGRYMPLQEHDLDLMEFIG